MQQHLASHCPPIRFSTLTISYRAKKTIGGITYFYIGKFTYSFAQEGFSGMLLLSVSTIKATQKEQGNNTITNTYPNEIAQAVNLKSKSQGHPYTNGWNKNT